MRWLSTFLAILILGLSLFPCTDTNAAAGPDTQTAYHLPGSQQGDDHEDTCPPFCYCSCCAMVCNYQHHFAELTIPESPYYSKYSADYLTTVIEVSIPVWQPPQLG